ncbi:hypothetical protein MRB53_039583 [Persea americana]|nr:hypothetical protein MRB53_039583 [Persea americana]
MYGTQRVIFFLRQLLERSGFWRASDRQWVKLQRVQIVGACNPPTDAGRHDFSQRFLRHATLILVHYPSEISLKQIYSTLIKAALKVVPNLRGFSGPLTDAMVAFYIASSKRFTVTEQAHYIYSPRELSRWVKGIAESHRLVNAEDRLWTNSTLDQITEEHFPTIDYVVALARPILYSNWLSKDYLPVSRLEIRDYIKARMRTFCEEEVDIPLVPYDEAVEHVLQIDRTTLTKFVAWMNGLKTHQLKIHRNYSAADFDDDLRDVLKRCGTKGEKICFLLDESNVLGLWLSGAYQYLASKRRRFQDSLRGTSISVFCRPVVRGLNATVLCWDSNDELYAWFTEQIIRNLHFVYTMNPPADLAASAATSPALFNRCVLNWLGDWSDQTLHQVAYELILNMDLDSRDVNIVNAANTVIVNSEIALRKVIVNVLVNFHSIAKDTARVASMTTIHHVTFWIW